MTRKSFKPQIDGPVHKTRRAAMDALIKYVDAFATGVTGSIPIDEKLSWPAKEAAARALVDGEETPDQRAFLKAEADLTGDTLEALAGIILQKAALYRAVVSRIAGLRRVTTAAIDAADPAADPGVFDAILADARDRAEVLAGDLGL